MSRPGWRGFRPGFDCWRSLRRRSTTGSIETGEGRALLEVLPRLREKEQTVLICDIGAWQPGRSLTPLANDEPDLAVARGAARYGKVLREPFGRITGGYPHSLYLEIQSRGRHRKPKLVCILPKEKRVVKQWWILWRRVAGGLDRSRQEEIVRDVLPAFRNKSVNTAEVFRLAGSLERVPQETKEELVDRNLQFILEKRTSPPTRYGPRTPVEPGSPVRWPGRHCAGGHGGTNLRAIEGSRLVYWSLVRAQRSVRPRRTYGRGA